ncbi:isochorismatase family protein [Saccharothrix saharensis]|uniref:isochorismatase family protein n=1 Tax=Saccharothrix saharensis TaxID=571190 RepID=UPI0036972FA6
MPIPPIQPYPMPTAESLPANAADWRIDPRRVVLLVHDMQKYFLEPFPESRSPRTELVANTAAVRERCAALGVPVAYTAQPGDMSPARRGLLRDFWGPGMTAGPEHREIVAPLAPRPGDWRLTKWRYSAFHRTELLELMTAAGRDQLLCCGVYAHVGILSTMVDALANDIQAFLVADAVADFDADFHRRTVEYAAARCAVVTTTRDVLARLPVAEPVR